MKYIVALAALATVAGSSVNVSAVESTSTGSSKAAVSDTAAAKTVRTVYLDIAADAKSGQFPGDVLLQRIDALIIRIDHELAMGVSDQLELIKVRNASLKVRDQIEAVASSNANGVRLIQITSAPMVDAVSAPAAGSVLSDQLLSEKVVSSTPLTVQSGPIAGSAPVASGGTFSRGGLTGGGGFSGGGGLGGGGFGGIGGRPLLLGGIAAAVAIPLSVDDDDDDAGVPSSVDGDD